MSKEKTFEDFFGILTNHEHLKDNKALSDYTIHEATEYEVLMRIFEDVYINPDDTIVDFGCGMGRVLFYCNNRFFCNVTGIEDNKEVYDKLSENAETYHKKFMEQEDKFSLLNIHAADYEINPGDNFFYFFNPFSADVLESIIEKIIKSVHENLRQVTIILYYCTYEMISVIRKFPLRLENVIKLPGYEEDPDEKAYIYRL